MCPNMNLQGRCAQISCPSPCAWRQRAGYFEGIHALNDIIVGKNPHAFKLYIAARSNLVDDEGTVVFQHAWLRLCRRIVRDHKFRGSDARFTLKMWANVRRGEKLYISPYKEKRRPDVRLRTGL